MSVSNNHVSGSNHVSHGSSNHVAARDPDDTSRADSSRLSTCSRQNSGITCYRFGSVGQDTLICLWDLTEDILKQAGVRSWEKKSHFQNYSNQYKSIWSSYFLCKKPTS